MNRGEPLTPTQRLLANEQHTVPEKEAIKIHATPEEPILDAKAKRKLNFQSGALLCLCVCVCVYFNVCVCPYSVCLVVSILLI